jgi:AcrR family transcriptional regulator
MCPKTNRSAATRVSQRRSKSPKATNARRAPRQERSRFTVADIVQAAAELFGKLGYAGTTTNKIAERAGVSIGSLYQYFSDKDDLLLVLLEHHQAKVRAVINTAESKLSDPDVPLRDGLRYLLHALLELHTEDPALSRVLSHGIHGPHARGARMDSNDDRYVDMFSTILRKRPEVHINDKKMAARVVVQTIGQLIRWLGHEAPPAVDSRAFVEEVLEMLMRYLVRRD